MVDISKIRSDFVIYVADDEESIREILKEALGGAGYQVEVFPDAQAALARLTEAPPHLIFSDIRMPGMNGIQFLDKVKKLSPTIEFIIMTSHASMETAVEAIKLGAYDYIYKPFENLSDVVTTADRTMEHVYLAMQNEQLLLELGEKNKLLATVNQRISQENQEIQQVNDLMQSLSQTLDPEEVIKHLLKSLSHQVSGAPAVFFRYFANNTSLVAQHSIVLPTDRIKNLGVNLSAFDVKKIPEILMQPARIPQLNELMKEVFQVVDFECFPFVHQNQAIGVIVLFEKFNSDVVRRLSDSLLQITRVSFDNAMMARKIHEMAVKDPLTGIYNRRFFNDRLDEEMTRSARTRYPLSLIYIDIDHFKKYNDTNGHPMGDVIIKSVAQILQKTSRKNDIVARLGGEEFAILCPHTSLHGAAIKAEKIRQTVEGTKFPNGEKQPLGKVTVSLGVSEYPSIVSDSQALIRSADDGLYQVKQGGRNKVCVATPSAGFKPDFEPLPVPMALEQEKIKGAG